MRFLFPILAIVLMQSVAAQIITPIDSANYDLSFLKEKIGDKRIVMLGEINHGDGTTFEHKTKVIEYLHKEMGFNVVAFEAPFAELEYLNEYNIYNIDSFKRRNYAMWKATYEMDAFYELAKENTLKLTGFDSKHVSGRTFIADSIAHYFNLQPDDNFELMKTMIRLEFVIKDSLNSFEINQLSTYLKSVQEKRPVVNNLHTTFWAKTVQCLNAHLVTIVHIFNNQRKALESRDDQMANNLNWLLDAYNDEKIIVWAANFHIAKNLQHVYNKRLRQKVMGDFISSYSDEEFYSILFLHEKGSYYYSYNEEKQSSIKKKKKNSLEAQLGAKNNLAFIDFKIPLKRKLNINAISHFHTVKTDKWNEIANGFYFIKESKPCTYK